MEKSNKTRRVNDRTLRCEPAVTAPFTHTMTSNLRNASIPTAFNSQPAAGTRLMVTKNALGEPVLMKGAVTAAVEALIRATTMLPSTPQVVRAAKLQQRCIEIEGIAAARKFASSHLCYHE